MTDSAGRCLIPPETVRRLRQQSTILDRVVQALQEVQEELPLPPEREVADLRRGGSLGVAAFLLGLLQRVILNVENAASDLRMGIKDDTLSRVDRIRPSAIEIKAIEAALDERLGRRDVPP